MESTAAAVNGLLACTSEYYLHVGSVAIKAWDNGSHITIQTPYLKIPETCPGTLAIGESFLSSR